MRIFIYLHLSIYGVIVVVVMLNDQSSAGAGEIAFGYLDNKKTVDRSNFK